MYRILKKRYTVTNPRRGMCNQLYHYLTLETLIKNKECHLDLVIKTISIQNVL